VLEVSGLSKYFGGLKAVDGVDISVKRGGVHALIGPNGSGKTTTLNVLSGLYKATAGRILLDGTDITTMPPHQRTAAGLGRTFQNIRLFRSMTALENVMLPGRIGRRSRNGSAEETLRAVGLGDRMEHLPADLSGGEQQRVAIARALVNDPRVIFADEPTGNLDSKTGDVIIDVLMNLARERSTTLLVVTHEARLAERADRTLHIVDGVVG